MVVGIYKIPESGAYQGIPLGKKLSAVSVIDSYDEFPIVPNPYGMEIVEEGKIIDNDSMDILARIENVARKARENAPVTYKDKDGIHHLVTRKEKTALEKSITSETAVKIKGIVEAFKGNVSPDLEERLAKVGIKRV